MTAGPEGALALAERAVPKLVRALAMFLEMGAGEGPEQCRWGLNECLKVMGKERFVAACVKAGMSKADAERMAGGG